MRSNSTALQQLRAEGVEVALAQQAFAHAVDAREFFLPRNFFFGDVRARRARASFARLVLAAQPFDVALVVVRRHQFILAARKKR